MCFEYPLFNGAIYELVKGFQGRMSAMYAYVLRTADRRWDGQCSYVGLWDDEALAGRVHPAEIGRLFI